MSRKVYFTFEYDDPYSGYDGGFAVVEADGYHEAVHAFEIFHPKRDGSSAVNCKQIYTDTEWETCPSLKYLKEKCRERITVEQVDCDFDCDGFMYEETIRYTRQILPE